jgi:hypothetical protein
MASLPTRIVERTASTLRTCGRIAPVCGSAYARGSKYGLWYGNHVYELEPQAKAARFAAENVRVTGELANDTIRIRSIALITK